VLTSRMRTLGYGGTTALVHLGAAEHVFFVDFSHE